ncbi:hypothetical protein QM007_04465 [Rothia sp. SD9660Na]|uniref:hypothetical protein n=1 Tax=Rothia sp. SD9660Na TaxID=3047030 RepID=UPI0024B888D5|nr:hypothetical protein [Rothia sp. SD9660Na]WHS51229.1 hypothetical protein QM007_04465 [Rothia sp. SD9660Na]
MKQKTYYAAGTALAVTVAPLALLAGQVLTGPQSAFAADPTESPAPTSSTPTSTPSVGESPSESPSLEVTVAPSATESPSPETPTPETPTPEPTSDPVPSADPEPVPAPSESVIVVPVPPRETSAPDVTGGAAGLPSLPAADPSAQPSAGTGQSEGSGATVPGQGTFVPSTLGNSVAGAQDPTRMDADTSQLETSPVDGTVLGIFSSSQQSPGYAGAPEWVEGFLNVSGAQGNRSSSADPNQAAGVAGAEAQGHQAGAVTGGSIFQRGNTIMNGARPLLIFTGIATAGLALVVFNFVWRNRAPRN